MPPVLYLQLHFPPCMPKFRNQAAGNVIGADMDFLYLENFPSVEKSDFKNL